jgi:hypothetical protein
MSYATLTNTPTTTPLPLTKPLDPIPHNIPTPAHTPDTSLDIMEIDEHKHLLHHTIYHVNK